MKIANNRMFDSYIRTTAADMTDCATATTIVGVANLARTSVEEVHNENIL